MRFRVHDVHGSGFKVKGPSVASFWVLAGPWDVHFFWLFGVGLKKQ